MLCHESYALPLYTAMFVWRVSVGIKNKFSLKTSPEARMAPVSIVQVYTRQFTCASVQLDQAMCVRYKWAKQSVFALPSIFLQWFLCAEKAMASKRKPLLVVATMFAWHPFFDLSNLKQYVLMSFIESAKHNFVKHKHINHISYKMLSLDGYLGNH